MKEECVREKELQQNKFLNGKNQKYRQMKSTEIYTTHQKARNNSCYNNQNIG